MITSQEFLRYIYEGDAHLTISGTGAKRQTKSGGTKTAVDTSPSTKVDAKPANDGPGAKGYDRNNRPNDHRPGKVEQAPQPYSPTNPQNMLKASKEVMDRLSLQNTTKAAQYRQWNAYKNRKQP